jgi:hypothetical protein
MYDDRMHRLLLLSLLTTACGGGSDHAAMPPKKPNDELILGEFARRPPDGTTAARFRADGSITVAHDKASLDTKPLATGTFVLDKDQLTLTYTGGDICKGNNDPGVYKIVLSKIGIRFTKVSDTCDDRAKLDGQTWFRVRP